MSDQFVQSEIRQKLIEALRTDLIGPRKGVDEVLEENPELSYLTGTLHTADGTDEIEFDDQEDIELESGDSDSLGEEDNEDKYSAKFKQQSSLGISFYLPESIHSFNVHLEWGDYIVDKKEEEDKNGKQKSRRVYTRLHREYEIEAAFGLDEKTNEYAAGEQDEGVKIKVSSYVLKSGYKLFSVYATNYRNAIDETTNGTMFQTRLSVSLKDGEVFVPEYQCRRELEDEYLYESRPVFARGHGCAADWKLNESGNAVNIFSEFIPEHEIPNVSPNLDGFTKGCFSMLEFSKSKTKEQTIEHLSVLQKAYVSWVDELSRNPKMSNPRFAGGKGAEIIGKCKEQAERILSGIRLLQSNDKAYKAFCFMNRCMFMQRSINSFSRRYGAGVQCNLREYLDTDHSEWRAFQIAFILLNLPCIIDYNDKYRNNVDLLYFPTGGGKTEAYLGLIAFLLGYRRLTADSETEFNKDGGVAVILRYTLRLLTTQQRDRLTKMIIAAEILRRQYLQKDGSFGATPFSIGFYVGGAVTPNRFSEFKNDDDDPGKFKRMVGQLNRQLITCPYCGKPLSNNNFHVDLDAESIDIYCSDKNCYFFEYNDERIPIPVYLVDEQIYRKCPSVVIATVDKFARLPWDVACNALFGRVDRYCPRHGYIAIGKEHEGRHNQSKTNGLPATITQQVKPFYPPELIVQDELHLITGPLGTIYGAYEAAIEELCSISREGIKILPKYIASTATISNADEQIRCLYGRTETAMFPPGGLDIRDSFFTREIPVEQSPFRKYCGIAASGKSVKTTLLRVYAILIQTALHLSEQPEYKDLIDPYYTLIGYFNSIRELGGTVRLLQDDIPKRQKWIVKHYNQSNIRYFTYKEVTSRMTSDKIAGLLKELESTIVNKTKGMDKKDDNFLDVAIATNMISVGLDIDRLGLMCVLGQPKQSSEYIQTTSRIGRAHPGLVVTVYNPYRPRDLSHYENFKGYHSHIYRFVEGTSATPFSARARDRVLHALFIALSRLQIEALAENSSAAVIDTIPKAEIDVIINKISARVTKVAPKLKPEVITEITEFIDTWKTCNQVNALPLYYYIQNTKIGSRLMNYYGELCSRNEKPTLNSMREVENTSTLYYYTEV
ncbi:helicase [Spirochaetia bacterium]|nr:helicase [Spirochaetia bacterium]